MLRLPDDWVWDSWMADDDGVLAEARSAEAEGVLSSEITAPIPVGIEDGALVAVTGDVPALLQPGPL